MHLCCWILETAIRYNIKWVPCQKSYFILDFQQKAQKELVVCVTNEDCSSEREKKTACCHTDRKVIVTLSARYHCPALLLVWCPTLCGSSKPCNLTAENVEKCPLPSPLKNILNAKRYKCWTDYEKVKTPSCSLAQSLNVYLHYLRCVVGCDFGCHTSCWIFDEINANWTYDIFG